jgi:GT2 family glycosyltransferase
MAIFMAASKLPAARPPVNHAIRSTLSRRFIISSAVSNSAPVRVQAKFFFEGDRKFFVKGVTYGPFAPDDQGDHFGSPGRARRDLAMMCDAGINLVRVYYVPPKWFMDACADHGIRCLISIPWAEHIEFLNRRTTRRTIEETVKKSVRTHRGHPALFGFLVGNEIPSHMVRWLGPQRVTEFLEHLIFLAKRENPEALYSYASFPPTEYLLPPNADFLTFNVYLHRREDFDRYLARLQNLAEDRPLLLGEFGMDTIRHHEEEQEEMIGWHIESVVRGGLAGTVIYSWTDEWFRGGQEITDWAFGLVTRDRAPKKAYHRVKKLFAGAENVTGRVPLERYPKVSVIVCSYNGGKTLRDCLTALDGVDYPDYEIVFVDDGSTDGTQEIVAAWEKEREGKLLGWKTRPDFQSLRQPNMGLSYARNAGAAAAKGEILAYTDSDCMADPDWLYYLVGTLLSGDYAGVGGPNISPPAQNWIQACVAAAPGGPSHVLLTDVVAEHIPGCNMAFHRAAFDQVGGFDAEFRKAGDDVDFCWRLQQSGQVIAFSPAAIVWHYRRFTLDAFRKQQQGYGEAESMLRFKHLVFFGPTGTAKWKGQIYGAPRFTWLVNRPLIYHGVFGEGLFQSIYPTPRSEIANYLSSLEWVVLSAVIFVISIGIPPLRIVPYLMLGGTFIVALSYMLHARMEPQFDSVRARLLVAFLAFTQPLVRGWSRYSTWLKNKHTPSQVIRTPETGIQEPSRGSTSRFEFWNEQGHGREKLLAETTFLLENEGWSYSLDTGWNDWDVQVYGSFWWIVRLRTVTEYHGGPKCLTRAELKLRAGGSILLTSFLLAGILAWQQFVGTGATWWALAATGGYLVFLTIRGRRLKRRLADLLSAAAKRAGLSRVTSAPAS